MAKKQEKLSLEEMLEQALVKDEDKPYEVPENWVWTRLGDIAEYKKGPFGSAITKSMFVDKGENTYKVYEQGNAIRKDISYGNYYISEYKYNELRGFAVSPYDVIVSCAGTVGETYLLPENAEPGIINQALMRIRTNNKIDLNYYLLCFQELLSTDISGKSKGTAIKNIPPFAVLKNVPFPLPPLAEQHRIVNLVGSFFEKLDRAKEIVQNALDSFENRKSAILHKAFTGELTAKWREENPTNENNILEKILNYYKKEAKNKDVDLLTEIQGNSIIMDEISDSVWYKCNIGAIGIVSNGSTPSRKENSFWNGNIPWVSSGEVKNNMISSTKELITEDGYNNSSVRMLKKGTVLIAMIGEGKTRGQSAILDIDATINQNIAAIDVSSGEVLSKFLCYWLQFQYKSNREGGSGTGPKALNCQRVRELPFVLPPLPEQQEIVRILDSLLENEQRAKELCNLIENINHMKKSILARAFRGELGTNNPEEESAVGLLKQVLQEK